MTTDVRWYVRLLNFVKAYWYLLLSGVILFFPIITNEVVLWHAPFRVASRNDWIGFYAAFFGAVIGGVISGTITYYGVRLTLDRQQKSDTIITESHRNALLAQLIFTYELFNRNYDEIPINTEQKVDFVVYDRNWNEHLLFIQDLNAQEIRYIVKWFYSIANLETYAKQKNGFVPIAYIIDNIEVQLPVIRAVIDMISSKRNHEINKVSFPIKPKTIISPQP